MSGNMSVKSLNIPIKHYQEVIDRLGYTPDTTFITTKRALGEKEKRFIEKHKLHYVESTKFKNADRTLIEFALEMGECYGRIIFLSSDSDFANAIKILLKLDKKVDLFTRHGANYRILMYLALDNPNLKIHSLEPQNSSRIKPISQPKEDLKPQKPIDRRVIITKPLPIIKECFVCQREYEFNKKYKFPTVCPYCRKLMVERYPFLTYEGNITCYFKEEYNESMQRYGYYDVNQRKEEPHLVLEDVDGDNFNTIDFTALTKKRRRG
ncbi:MAG: hypothetical protein RBT59_01570 [Arcobacteraceae bacterium]|jgi:hypothetical protein|nr:hypothetical protein [Arcobacteraceae bacterium]